MAKDVIVKEAKDGTDSRRAMDALVKDAHILSTIRHPNIVNIMAVCDDPPFVVMQYYEEGSLYDVLKRCRREERIAARFHWMRRLTVAIDVCCGMIFLHSQSPPILHRDLKSPNVFIEKDFTGASVGDFNLSKGNMELSPAVGSIRPSNPMWQAPEVAKGHTDFTISSDIYAFGIVMWEILTTRQPWDHLKTGTGSGREIFFGRIRYCTLLYCKTHVERFRYELFDNRRPKLNRDEKGELMGITGGSFPQIESYIQLMESCWTGNPNDRPESFEVIVAQLEVLRKQLQEWKMANISRASAGTRRMANEAEETRVKRTSSEPEDILKNVLDNKDLPPKSPQIRTPYTVNTPPSPFDRPMLEDMTDARPDAQTPQENVSSELPISPFN